MSNVFDLFTGKPIETNQDLDKVTPPKIAGNDAFDIAKQRLVNRFAGDLPQFVTKAW